MPDDEQTNDGIHPYRTGESLPEHAASVGEPKGSDAPQPPVVIKAELNCGHLVRNAVGHRAGAARWCEVCNLLRTIVVDLIITEAEPAYTPQHMAAIDPLPEPDDVPTTGAPVTVCHKPGIGLRASQICKVCNGDLAQPYGADAANAVNSPPIENTVMLPCMHWAVVLHTHGDRLVHCPHCDAQAIVRAKEVRTIRYVVDAATTQQTTLDVGL
jgi:hypothetical protein